MQHFFTTLRRYSFKKVFVVFQLDCVHVQRWQDAEDEKASPQRRDMAFYLLTETNLVDELKEAFPNGNMILREDYQKSFKKRVRFQDLKTFLKE